MKFFMDLYYLPILLFALLISHLLISYLSKHHSGIYAEMGKPKLTDSNLSRSAWALQGFLWKFKFFKLHDVRLTLLCLAVLLLELILVIYVYALL
ncbi:hypothetical protein CAP31_04130 [Sulfuriferula sp. AH1]|nr:hypothetical protein CAP31_04130 [Sulfuriferula sp. AH1]